MGIAAAHRIPAVDRAVEVLEALSAAPAGVRDLAIRLGIPRSTVYRVLNSLEAGGLAARGDDNAYRLGPRLLRLARAVPHGFDLVALARPRMEQLAHALRRSVKLSILDAGAALVVAVAESPETYSVTTQVGRRFPLHAGAASKVLAAFADDAVRASLFAAPLPRFTPATIVDRARLRRDLATVRQRGYATDVGEFAPAIKAIAAPIFGPEGSCVAAVSIPYVGTLRATAERAIRAAVVRAAEDLSRSLGGR